jgi:hypothetical protein
MVKTDPTSGALYQRQMRQTRKALGLCNCCTGRAEPGKTHCRIHLAVKNKARARNAEKKKLLRLWQQAYE